MSGTIKTHGHDGPCQGTASSGPTRPRPGPFEREVAARLLRERRACVTGQAERKDHESLDQGEDDLADLDLPPFPGHRTSYATPTTWQAPMQVAAALCFARTVDAVPGLADAFWTGTPRVVLEIEEPLAFAAVRRLWAGLLFEDGGRIEAITRSLSPVEAGAADVLLLTASESIKPREQDEAELAFLQALQVARPILVLATDARTCLPAVALRAADHRLSLAPLDLSIVLTTIYIVTGRRCRAADRARLESVNATPTDLAIAIRADRRPAACVAEMVRLAGRDTARTGLGRDLSLDQLHGMKPAVDWARSTLQDLMAWRAGAPWQTVSSGAVITGPPGCGKTLLAAVMAGEAGLHFIPTSLARWQSEDQAHLGSTLRAMRRTFEEARLRATGNGRRGSLILLDECDSFPNRAQVVHDHRDYVVEVVNSVLEHLDGAISREGVIVIGTTNDARRCDPALLRPGRLGTLIEIGYPDLDERLQMLRVRLGEELPDADLRPVARLTERTTGAEIEQLVADARRLARRAGRTLEMADLLVVAGRGDADMPAEIQNRIAIHEAGHAVVNVLELGPEGLVVALQTRGSAAGWVEQIGAGRTAGTRADIETRIRILLAGRAAEEVALGGVSAGARQDLVSATSLAANLIGSWGLGQRRLLSLGYDQAADILTEPALQEEAEALLEQLYDQTVALVRDHEAALMRVAKRLLAERRLDGLAVAEMLKASRIRGTRSRKSGSVSGEAAAENTTEGWA